MKRLTLCRTSTAAASSSDRRDRPRIRLRHPAADQGRIGSAANFEPTAWYSIGHDGKVVVTVGNADMGQHVASTMAQLVAEELEAPWKDMSVVFASTDPKYNDPVLGVQITGGSWSTEMNFDAMGRADATGRLSLIKAAAEMLGVPENACRASESTRNRGRA